MKLFTNNVDHMEPVTHMSKPRWKPVLFTINKTSKFYSERGTEEKEIMEAILKRMWRGTVGLG